MLGNVSKIGIWGYGKEGQAAHQFLIAQYPQAHITILTDKPIAPDHNISDDVAYLSGDDAMKALSEGYFDLVVKSPGISRLRSEIQTAEKAGTKFTSNTNLWFEHNQLSKSIGITGTKGKSTVSTLLYHAMLNQNQHVKLLGNGGIPPLGQTPGTDATILELSSYQIADLRHSVDIAVINNLFPEHAPWHGSVENYYQDKLQLLNLNPNTIGIVNFENETIRRLIANRPNIIWFNHESGYMVEGGDLLYQGKKVTIQADEPLKGSHNISNIAAVATVLNFMGLLDNKLDISIKGYKGLPHRLEEMELSNGITAVNDSIATIPEAVIAALDVYRARPVYLILGGSDRGQDYNCLIQTLKNSSVKSIYLLPDTGHKIANDIMATNGNISIHVCERLEDAISRAQSEIMDNSVLLLSPGAPSFNQFANFEERGNLFKQICEKLWVKANEQQLVRTSFK